MDLLALREWEVSGLALCGTAVSSQTLALLNCWEHVYVVLDSDAAGREAAAHIIAALGSRAINVTLPLGAKDPADLAPLAEGATLFRSAIEFACCVSH